MMTKLFRLSILMLAITLLSSPAIAIWETQPQEDFYGEQNNALIDGFNVKVNEVDVDNREARVTIKNTIGNIVYQGVMTPNEGYTKKNVIKITAGEFRQESPITPQVKFEVAKWVDVKFETLNFPEKAYKNDAYKVFAIVSNPGKNTNTYRVELSAPEKLHINPSSQSETPSYRSTLKEVKRSASQTVEVDPGKQKKVYFKFQPAGRDRIGVADPVLRIYTENDQLMKEVEIPQLEIVNSQVGYIEDVIVPSGMISGNTRSVEVRVRNSWMSASDDFYLELKSPEFLVEDHIRQMRISAGRTQGIKYELTPYGGGDFTITAILNIGQKTVDQISADIPVVGDKVYAIKEVKSPQTMRKGESEPVFVTVANRVGTTNKVSLELESDDFDVKNPRAVLQLSGNSEHRVAFTIQATTDRRYGSFTLNLYDEPDNYAARQFERNKKVADTQTVTVNMQQEDTGEAEETETPEETVTNETVEENVTVVPKEPEENQTQPGMEEKEPEKRAYTFQELKDYWPYIAIGVLVILAIILIVLGEKKRKKKKGISNVEIVDLEEDSDKKK